MTLDELFESNTGRDIPTNYVSEWDVVVIEVEELIGKMSRNNSTSVIGDFKEYTATITDLDNGLRAARSTLKVDGYDVQSYFNIDIVNNNDVVKELKHILGTHGYETDNNAWFSNGSDRTLYTKHHGRMSEEEVDGNQPDPRSSNSHTGQTQYNPQQAQRARMTPAANSRNARLRQASNRDNIGGDSSNYTRRDF